MSCTNKTDCRCDGCFNRALAKSVQQTGARLPARKKAKRQQREIYAGLGTQVMAPKQPKSCAGQLSLLDFIGE